MSEGATTARAVVLVVDDEEPLRQTMCRALTEAGHVTLEARDGEEALARLRSTEVDAVLLDLRLPGRSGLDVLDDIKRLAPATEVIILTGHGTIPAAVEAMRRGAHDFEQKPFRLERLLARLARALDRRALAQRAAAFAGPTRPAVVWGESPAMAAVRGDLERVAPTSAAVLVLGESGTGKELVARELHARSPRAAAPFVALNCAAVPSSLAESLLFGHERGAFSGADRRRLGLLEVASGGTLFLDELAELPWDCQAKLLRALQEREVLRVGASEPVRVDLRVVGATNRDIDEAVETGDFRPDLLHRMDTVRLHLPPLRDRPVDLPALCAGFLRELSPQRPRALEQGALAALARYHWPGNVRELRKVLERIVILCDHDRITAGDVEERLPHRPPEGMDGLSLEAAERQVFERALARSATRAEAARRLGVSLRTLYTKLKQHRL
jgi:DNA-binding NtrC family response regulator